MTIRELFKQAGLKVTPQRKIIYELMQELQHSLIDTIIARVQEQDSGMTTSSVYRIPDSFCRVNLLSRVNHPNGKIYFDINPSEHHHIFIDDGKIVDYSDPELSELIKKELKGDIFKDLDIERISVQIFTKNN